jgi:hypothetical protein
MGVTPSSGNATALTDFWRFLEMQGRVGDGTNRDMGDQYVQTWVGKGRVGLGRCRSEQAEGAAGWLFALKVAVASPHACGSGMVCFRWQRGL